jgi:hypothetical protein
MAKDIYHEAVKNTLIKDGWTILADSYFLQYRRCPTLRGSTCRKNVISRTK